LSNLWATKELKAYFDDWFDRIERRLYQIEELLHGKKIVPHPIPPIEKKKNNEMQTRLKEAIDQPLLQEVESSYDEEAKLEKADQIKEMLKQVQCAGHNKNGARCGNLVLSFIEFCESHQGQSSVKKNQLSTCKREGCTKRPKKPDAQVP